MHHRSHPASRLRASFVSIAISTSMLISFCGPFLMHKARAQAPLPGQPPAPSVPGKPPGPNLPNLDVVRTLPSVAPEAQALGPLVGMAPICDAGADCGVVGGGGGGGRTSRAAK